MTNPLPAISIRPLATDDFEMWLDYWQQYQVFYQVELPDATTQTTWRRFFDPQEPVHAVVACDGERILGFAHYLFHRSTWGQNDFCYLEDLFVSPTARGLRIGQALIAYVQAQAQQQRCDRFYWHTQASNHRAQRLYDRVAEQPGVIEYRLPLDRVETSATAD